MLAGFVIAALATVLIALVNFRTAQVRSHAVEAMDETTVTMRHLNLFVSSLKDAETGQRGYLLTGDDTYLQPYNLSLSAMQRNMARLKELTDLTPCSAAWCCRSKTCTTKSCASWPKPSNCAARKARTPPWL
jgi:CHASE3 domain sensor protein